MNRSNRVFKNTIYLIVGQFFTIALGMIWMAFFVRYVGAKGNGQYAIAQSTLAIIVLFVEFGLQNLVIRSVSQDKKLAGKYLIATFSTKLVLSILVFGCFFSYLGIQKLETGVFGIMAAVALNTFIFTLTQSITAILYAYEKMGYDAAGQLIQSLIGCVLVLLAIHEKLSLFQILLLLSFSALIRFVWNFCFLFRLDGFKLDKDIFRIDWNFNWELFLKSMPFAALTIISVVWSNIVVLLLRHFSNDIDVGYFSAAQRIYSFLFILPAMFLTAVFPAFSSSFKESSENFVRMYKKSYQYIFAITAPMAIGVALMAKPVILLLFGEQFMPAVRPLQILGFALLNGVGFVNGAALVAIGKEYFYTLAFGIILFASVVFSFLAIPYSGAEGASYIVIFGNASGLFVFSWFMFRWLKIKYPFTWIIKVLVATTVMGLSGFFLTPYVPIVIVGAVVCPLVYLGMLKMQKTLTNDDLTTIKGLWQSSLSTIKCRLK